MNREDTIRTIREMGEILAIEMGLNKVEVGEVDCGFWDKGAVKLSDILKKEYGEMETVTFHDDAKFKGRWSNTIEVGYRFSSPRIIVRCRREDKREWLASMEFSDYEYKGDELEHTGDYTFSESQVWMAEGIKMFNRLQRMWAERGGK